MQRRPKAKEARTKLHMKLKRRVTKMKKKRRRHAVSYSVTAFALSPDSTA